jgi:hypothetical protein
VVLTTVCAVSVCVIINALIQVTLIAAAAALIADHKIKIVLAAIDKDTLSSDSVDV